MKKNTTAGSGTIEERMHTKNTNSRQQAAKTQTKSGALGEVAVHSARELRLGGVPLAVRLEGDVRRGVVDDRKR